MKLRNVLVTLALLTGCMYGQSTTVTPPLVAGESATMSLTPSATPASVQKYTFTQPHNMIISTTTPGAYICYGSMSNPASDGKGGCLPGRGTVYTAPIGVTFNRSIYAVAWAPGYSDSAVAEAIFTFAAPTLASSPAFILSGVAANAANKYTFTVLTHTLTLTSTTPKAIICYSATSTPATDGLGVGCKTGSTLYTVPFAITFSRSIYAVAGAAGYKDSPVTEGVFTTARK